jgi:ATP-dependent Clp protease adaptor protein ClpS
MSSVTFEAVVESARGGGHVVEVDRALADRIGAKHMTRVRGTLDGTEYRSNVASMGDRLVLGVHKGYARGGRTRHRRHGRDHDVRGPRAAGAGPVNTGTTTATPARVQRPSEDEIHEPDLPWIVIVWNDPINLMSYVTWVFMRLFGYPREKAERLMWDVHTKGRAVVSSGPREKAESDVARLHAHGLWATLQRDA